MIQPTPPTASRHSLTAFLRYADAIAAVLSAWPNAVTFDPAPLSVETFAARFRDAMTGAVRYDYNHPRIDRRRLGEVLPNIVVAIRDNVVVAGSPSAVKAVKPVGSPLEATPAHSVITALMTLDGHRFDIVEAMALILSERVLTIQIKIVNPPSDIVERLAKFDVAIELRPDGTAIML